MEQHPIPQDITGFKFKLVGDMTIRQFGYLAAGLVLGWIIYSTPWYPFIRLPLAGLLAFAGVAFAFIPVEDRPLDIWVVNFFKAIYKPTFLVWQKANGQGHVDSPLLAVKQSDRGPFHFPQLWPLPKINLGVPKIKAPADETVAEKTEQMMPAAVTTNSQSPTPTTDTQTSTTNFISPELTPEPKPVPIPESGLEPVPTPEPIVVSKPLSIDELERLRAEKLAQISQNAPPKPTETPDQAIGASVPITSGKIDVTALEQMRKIALTPKDPETEKAISKHDEQLKELVADNLRIANSVEDMKQQMTALGNQDTSVLVKNLTELEEARNQITEKIAQVQEAVNHLRLTPITEEPPKPKPASQIRVVPYASRPIQTISLSDMPNVISGLIKDEKGNALPSVIVLIKDQAGSPLRALKTNKIGQFITNTPLENGTYYLEMERQDWNFETLEIKLTGQVVPLIEMTGKQNGHN